MDGIQPHVHQLLAENYMKSLEMIINVEAQQKHPIVGCAKPKGSPVVHRVVSFGHVLSGDTGSGSKFTRSSNGRVWSEYVADRLGTEAVLSYAWAGARTDGTNVNTDSEEKLGFSAQIARYVPKNIKSTLHTISMRCWISFILLLNIFLLSFSVLFFVY